jgi:YebC/PmpR family DNA-binding regulatory protein
MSGHSKWSQIKHKKAVVDSKRSKEFGKLARLIAVESRLVQGDVSSPTLKTIIEKAKAVNMPKENIERAVLKGVGGEGGVMEKITYELYGPGGVALLIDTITDNRNRTVQELKHLVSKLGFQLAEPGSASWAFTKGAEGWVATTTTPVREEDALRLAELVNTLEEYDDVDTVYTNSENS